MGLVVQLNDIQISSHAPVSSNPDENEFCGDAFMNVACDMTSKYSLNPEVLLFGCTEEGESVCIRVNDFKPSLLYKMNGKTSGMLCEKLANMLRVNASDLVVKERYGKHLYGWEPNSMSHPTDRKEHGYFQVFFPNVQIMRSALYKTSADEGHIAVETKFLDETGLIPSGWFEVAGDAVYDRISHCKYEQRCSMKDLKSLNEKIDIARMMVAAVDIECVSDSGDFPDAGNPEDIICQIGAVFWRMHDDVKTCIKVLYCVGDCAPIADTIVQSCSTERAMLSLFRYEFVKLYDPDIVTTYNGFGFDWEYLYKRAELLGCEDFFYLDRVVFTKSRGNKKELSSSALGNNDLFIATLVGRCNLDLFHWVKREHKLESYKLDNVSEHFLKERKVEMSPKDLFVLARGSAEDKAQVGVYCVKDCWLLIALIVRLQIVTANVQMSRVTLTLMELLETRGQQIKVMNQLVRDGHGEGYILNMPKQMSGSADDKYEGATVLEAKEGYYGKEPVVVNDYLSLYPSIIRANNFCFSCIVLDDAFLNIPGVEYEVIETQGKKYVWAKGMPGLLQLMLERLLNARAATKKKMAQASDPITRANLNKYQLALKISANSVYGFTGAVKRGKYYCLAVADCVTFKSRTMLKQTTEWAKLYTQKEFGVETDVVYGDTDSVMLKFVGVTDLDRACAIGQSVADHVTDKFGEIYPPGVIILEREKAYKPYLLLGKKKYAGLLHEVDDDGKAQFKYLDAKGLEMVRRDRCGIAKKIQSDVLDALMYKDLETSHSILFQHLQSLVQNTVPVSEYKACHAIVADDGTAIVKGGRNAPNLYGIYDRQAAVHPDFKKYGKSLVAAGTQGLVWNETDFVAYVADPKKF